jgi:hypothetical protein
LAHINWASLLFSFNDQPMRVPMPNPAPADGLVTEGFVVEVGGQFNSAYASLTAALKAGLQIKNRDSNIQVKVYDAKDRA